MSVGGDGVDGVGGSGGRWVWVGEGGGWIGIELIQFGGGVVLQRKTKIFTKSSHKKSVIPTISHPHPHPTPKTSQSLLQSAPFTTIPIQPTHSFTSTRYIAIFIHHYANSNHISTLGDLPHPNPIQPNQTPPNIPLPIQPPSPPQQHPLLGPPSGYQLPHYQVSFS